jgi:WD40 repeat protein
MNYDFSKDERLIMVAREGLFYIWDLASGAMHGPRDAGSFVWDAQFLPDSSGMIVLTEAGEMLYYSTDLTVVKNLGNFPETFEFTLAADNRFVILQDAEQKIHFLDLRTPTPLKSTRYVTVQPYSAFVLSEDGRWLIAGSGSDPVPRIWDLNDLHGELEENLIRIFPGGQDGEITGSSYGQNPNPSFALSPDGRWLANIAESNGQLFDLTGTIADTIFLDSDVQSLAFSPDSQWLAVHAGPSETVDVWMLGGDRPLPGPSFDVPASRWALSQVEFSPDVKWLVTNNYWQVIALPWTDRDQENWQAFGPKPPTAFGGGGGGQEGFRPGDNQVFSPDGQWIVFGKNSSATNDEGIESPSGRFIWNLGDLSKDPLELQDPFSLTNHMSFSPDGHWLAVVPDSGGIAILWELTLPEPATRFVELIGNRRLVSAIAFSSDSRWLATGHGNDVYLWDLTSQNPATAARILQGHTGIIWSLAFSPDGQTLASGSRDQTIRLWDMNASNITTSAILLEGHTAEVYDILYANDSTLVSNSLDGTTRFWRLNFAEMLALACREAGRNFTEQEWDLYFSGETSREICAEWSSSAVPTTAAEINGADPTAIATLPPTGLPVAVPTSTNPPSNVATTPTVPAAIQYTVQSGDSLTSIANEFNVPMDWIIQDNNITDPNAIREGQVLVIRVNATATPDLSVTP